MSAAADELAHGFWVIVVVLAIPGVVRLSPGLRQTVKTLFAVR